MVDDDGKIDSFFKLKAWQEGHKLALMIYDATDSFPEKERFILVSQLCRAAISVTSNIAEGFGRVTKKDKEHFYTIANGSLYEIKSQLLIARDRHYMDEATFLVVAEQANIAHKILHGLLKVHKEGR
jgi:four helix bundle protein